MAVEMEPEVCSSTFWATTERHPSGTYRAPNGHSQSVGSTLVMEIPGCCGLIRRLSAAARYVSASSAGMAANDDARSCAQAPAPKTPLDHGASLVGCAPTRRITDHSWSNPDCLIRNFCYLVIGSGRMAVGLVLDPATVSVWVARTYLVERCTSFQQT